MADRTFSLDEAHMLLPILESLLRQAINAKKLIADVDNELQELAHRVFLNGGMLLNVVQLARRKAEREKAIRRIKDALAEIDATGVQVKDIDIGLLDFPCKVEGEILLLCWKLGEAKITHWHGTEEGFAGRKPIDDRIAKANKAPDLSSQLAALSHHPSFVILSEAKYLCICLRAEPTRIVNNRGRAALQGRVITRENEGFSPWGCFAERPNKHRASFLLPARSLKSERCGHPRQAKGATPPMHYWR